MALSITGRVFDIELVNDKICRVILQKQVRGEKVPMAFAVYGKQRDLVLNQLKLKKKDKITANFDIKSRMYNGRWYTDVNLYNIELVPPKEKPGPENQEELDFEGHGDYIIDDETGEVLL